MLDRGPDKLKAWGGVLLTVALVLVVCGTARAQENSESMLTYLRGQSVMPAYEGWHPNADGTIDLWFGYLNVNYQEEVDIPVGPANNISPQMYRPDGGQPTHFLPRNNRWTFAVRVPKDFGDKEVVWTLTSRGKTYRAYATLKAGYLHDDIGMQREFFGEPPLEGNAPPVVTLEGSAQRVAKVGQAGTMAITVTDDGRPVPGVRGVTTSTSARTFKLASICGEDTSPENCGDPNERAGSMFIVRGLRMGCFMYRGPVTAVAFDPPQEKMWEDHKGGTPWATGYVYPPIPKGNKWMIRATFQEAGTYVVRCQASDGLLSTNRDVTFTVTP